MTIFLLPYLRFKSISLFQNYLNNRKHRTLVNNIISDPLTQTHGICQGSILGPLTFLLYINDIGFSIKKCNYKLFADDTVIYSSDDNIDTSIKNLNDDLKSVNEWCKDNNMAINIKKTKSMVFGRKNKTRKCKKIVLNLENKAISQTKLYKYLGVTLDENLTYNCHINQILKNANHKLYLLRRNRKFLTTDSAILLYKSHILPILEYGSTIFMEANSKHLDRLQTTQNSGLKSCLEASKYTSTNIIHKKAKLNKLVERREIQLLKDMFKRSQNSNYLVKKTTGIVTRSMSSVKLKVPHYLNSQAQKAIMYRGSNAWNSQHKSIKDIKNQHIFNLKMKEILRKKLSEYNV